MGFFSPKGSLMDEDIFIWRLVQIVWIETN